MRRRKKHFIKQRCNNKNIIVIGFIAVLMFIAASCLFIIQRGEKKETDFLMVEEPVVYETETGIYQNPEIAAGDRNFLNQKSFTDGGDDKREPFRIIEVIPHEICSLFPYLVEWDTIEGYNKNTPLGYEGLLLTAMDKYRYDVGFFCRGTGMSFTTDARPFTFKQDGFAASYLSVYKNNVGERGSGIWYRYTDNTDTGMATGRNGYFEYVGDNLGLYHINTAMLAEASGQSGIHYEMQAMNRKASELPQGDLYVEAPAYYWSKDHISYEWPEFNGEKVVSQTDFNYSLFFEEDSSGVKSVYRPDIIKEKVSQTSVSAVYDYFLVADDPDNWDNGFSYDGEKRGNYKVTSAVEAVDGDYIRIADNDKMDGFVDGTLSPGHFALYTPEYGAVPRYQVTFAVVSAAEKGFYTANLYLDMQAHTDYSFVYAGDGKGKLAVTFVYNTSLVYTGKLYNAKLLEVSHGQGDYALTSTKGVNQIPNYVKEGALDLPRDYSKIITYLDFADQIGQSLAGVSIGGDGTMNSEKGNWVFVEVSDVSKMKLTNLADIYNKTNFSVGDKIYVNNQTRRIRQYKRNGFRNNEWFKLLCYSSDPDNKNAPYVTSGKYLSNMTPEQNMDTETSQRLIKQFDNDFRIEIVQRTPGELTVEEINSADLIYISTATPFQGLTGGKWEEWSAELVKKGIDPLPALPSGSGSWESSFKYPDDFSTEAIYAIFDKCIYEQSCALMLSTSLVAAQYGYATNSNYMKLLYLTNYFSEAKLMAQFMPWYAKDRKDEFSRLCEDGYIETQKNTDGKYNVEEPPSGDDAKRENTWKFEHFQYTVNGKTYGTGTWFANNFASVQDGETRYICSQYVAGNFQSENAIDNIWKILHNRKVDDATISVLVTNAEELMDVEMTKVIYADEFDPQSFDIEYVIMSGGSGSPLPLADVTVAYSEGGGLVPVKSDTTPAYNVDYKINVRDAFTVSSGTTLNPAITMRKFTITATATNGKTGSTEVWVIVREAFDLN